MAIKKVLLMKNEPKEKKYSIGDAFQYIQGSDYIIEIVSTPPMLQEDKSVKHFIQFIRITDGFSYSECVTEVKDPLNIEQHEFETLLKNSGGIKPEKLIPFNYELVQIPNE